MNHRQPEDTRDRPNNHPNSPDTAGGLCVTDADTSRSQRARTGESVEGVMLSVDKGVYRQGEEATVHLINGSDREIGYNACFSARESRMGGEWVRIESLRMCTAALYLLDPGERTSFSEPISNEWGAGRYRIVLRFYPSDEAESLLLATNPFDVTS